MGAVIGSGGETCGGSASCTPAYRADDRFGDDLYPAGKLFLGTNAVPTFALNSNDLSFETYMAPTAMPEPAGWLVLLAGFLSVAAASRLRVQRSA